MNNLPKVVTVVVVRSKAINHLHLAVVLMSTILIYLENTSGI